MILGSTTLGIGILGTTADGTAAGMAAGAGTATLIIIITTGTMTSDVASLPEHTCLETTLLAQPLAQA